MPKQLDITDPKIVARHVKAMVSSTGYQIVLQYLNIDREEIIEAGKKARANEKQIKMWATLEGFDGVVKRINQLANLPMEDDDSGYSED